MMKWSRYCMPLAVLSLAAGLVGACARTPTLTPAVLPEPGGGPRPAALAAGPLTRITRPDTVNSGYGEAVDISGDTLVIGATYWNVGWGDQYGHVYVYRREGGEWVEQARLASSDGQDGFQYDQHFGRAVAVEAGFGGDILVVGAPDADHPSAGDNTGAVYVFRRAGDTWEEEAKLEAAEPRAHERFGNQVQIYGETIAVAGDMEDALYVFAWEGGGWVQQAQLQLPLPSEERWRHVSLALYGDMLAAGVTRSAPFMLEGSGTVFVYERQGGGWRQSARLEGDKDFGVAVALGASPAAQAGQADTLAIGAGGDTSAGLFTGAVYVYGRRGQGWSQQARLTAPDALMDLPFPTNNTFFGSSVALQGDLLLVQARFSSAVYVYQGQGAEWTDQLKVIIDWGVGEPEIWPLAIDGSTVVRGTPGEFGNSAHVFEILPR